MPVTRDDCEAAALSFAQHLANRAYEAAYAMTSADYRAAATLDRLKEDFEAIVPLDWGTAAPIQVVHTLDNWPDKRASDVLWVYVSIGGDVYSEALTVVFTAEDDQPRIRQVEFGRP